MRCLPHAQGVSMVSPRPALPLTSEASHLHLSRWELFKLVSTAFLISLAMTSVMAAFLWFVS